MLRWGICVFAWALSSVGDARAIVHGQPCSVALRVWNQISSPLGHIFRKIPTKRWRCPEWIDKQKLTIRCLQVRNCKYRIHGKEKVEKDVTWKQEAYKGWATWVNLGSLPHCDICENRVMIITNPLDFCDA